MVVTIGYAPLVVPLAVEGAGVHPLEIAQSLVLFMLIPLGIGLLIRARLPELADDWVGAPGRPPRSASSLASAARSCSPGARSWARSGRGSSPGSRSSW